MRTSQSYSANNMLSENLPVDQQGIDDIRDENPKYYLNVNTRFEDLDDLARTLAQILKEVEKNRHPILGFRGLDAHGDMISGSDWEIERLDYEE